MKIRQKLKVILRYMIPTIIVMIGAPLLQRTIYYDDTFDKEILHCIIVSNPGSPMNYSVGYQYEMLSRFAEQMEIRPDIRYGGREYLDSVLTDSIDIVVMPFSDSLIYDEKYYSSIPLADSSAWIIDGRLSVPHKEINTWLARFCLTKQHDEMVGRFTPAYEPYGRMRSGKSFKVISPYDKLIGKYAAELGWDRTLLTALVWQESRFHIEAQSRRGATGLMQMMPRTASHYKTENFLDPEENLNAATTYLKHLQKMFSGVTKDKTELMKFVLAAYNAGEGRIQDCINYASSIGAPHASWSDIVEIIPDMREDSILDADTVKLGKFKGYETINYVSRILNLNAVFANISGSTTSIPIEIPAESPGDTTASGQSLPDPLPTQKDTAEAEAALSQDK